MYTGQFDIFRDKEKAIHQSLWLNFQHRLADFRFGVVDGPDNDYAVMDEATRDDMGFTFLETPVDYTNLSFDGIRHLRMDRDPLPHLAEITGTFSIMNGELLRFILETKLPLEKLIRYELAIRGYDKNQRWVGFEKSEQIWLENEQ
jgi:hypothetical protein